MRRLVTASVAVTALLILGPHVEGVRVMAAPPPTNASADLDQCRNGSQDSPVACTGTAWVNGNAGAQNAHWLEGDSIVYRMRFSGLATGTVDHFLTIEWDTTQSGKHALDYLTSFNRTMNGSTPTKVADPCSNVAGCSTPTTFQIPQDLSTGLGEAAGTGRWDQVFTLYNGTIQEVSAYTIAGSYAGSSSTRITIKFRASHDHPVLAWGGHIATRADWGTGMSAVAINGSPYHMRLIDLDGSGGNQDRSLSSAAVIFPAKLTIVKLLKNAAGDLISDSTPFGFTTTTNPVIPGDGTQLPNTFSLKPNGVDNALAADLVLFGTTNKVVVTEDASSAAYVLDSVVCVDSDGGLGYTENSTGDKTTRTATIISQEAELITCTFTNKQQAAKLTVIKNLIKDNGGTALESAFKMHVKNSSGSDVTGSPKDGSSTGVSFMLAAGNYVVSEDGVTGYTQTGITGCAADGSITLAPGDDKTCTITNDDDKPTLTLNKVVVNDNGGTRPESDWTLTANGNTAGTLAGPGAPGSTDVVSGNTFKMGTYTLSEALNSNNAGTGDYDASAWSCVKNGGTAATVSSIAIGLGDTVVCTITNDDKANAVSIVTKQKVILHDRATINGIVRNSDESDSKVTFRLYATIVNGVCTTELGSEDVAISFGGNTSTTSITVGTATGVEILFDNAGTTGPLTRYWTASYSGNTLKATGNALNTPKTSLCNESTQLTIVQ